MLPFAEGIAKMSGDECFLLGVAFILVVMAAFHNYVGVIVLIKSDVAGDVVEGFKSRNTNTELVVVISEMYSLFKVLT